LLQAVSELGEREHRNRNGALTTQKKLDKVLSKINSTPMKCLGHKTPSEFFAKCGDVALAS
jgi:IS30 family transposase